MDFKDQVFKVVSRIAKGETLTYKEVATKAHRSRAYCTVGNILNKNFNPDIPCHRVICSDGKTGGYNRGATRKVKLLRLEKGE